MNNQRAKCLDPAARKRQSAQAIGIRNAAANIPGGRHIGALLLAGAGVGAGAFVARSVHMGSVLAAVTRANLWLLAAVVILGGVIQLARGERARRLLMKDREVTLRQSYGPMVMGNGLGNLLPLAPGGPLLRSVLTERLAGIPLAFSSGVFLLEGTLDGLGPALLIGYLLLARTLPTWTRGILMASLAQAVVFLLAPLLLKALPHRPKSGPGRGGRFATLLRLGLQVEQGLTAILTRGRQVALSIVGLSLLVTALSALQSTLFLRAFGLGTSINDVLLVFVLITAAGTIPINLPGAGTVAAAAALQAVGIHGAGVAGYVLISRLVLFGETGVLALALLGWWSATGYWRTLRLGSVLSLFRGQMRPMPTGHCVE